MELRLPESCSTTPSLSTTNTRPTHTAPNATTTRRMTTCTWASLGGVLAMGRQKSSTTTAAMELSPVDSELRAHEGDKLCGSAYLPGGDSTRGRGDSCLSAALNTPATKSPGSPGYMPRVSMTSSGSTWSLARASWNGANGETAAVRYFEIQSTVSTLPWW